MPLRPSILRAVDVLAGYTTKVTGTTAPSSATGCPSLSYRASATLAHGPSNSRTGCRWGVRESDQRPPESSNRTARWIPVGRTRDARSLVAMHREFPGDSADLAGKKHHCSVLAAIIHCDERVQAFNDLTEVIQSFNN